MTYGNSLRNYRGQLLQDWTRLKEGNDEAQFALPNMISKWPTAPLAQPIQRVAAQLEGVTMMLICAKCGSADLQRQFRGTPQERWICVMCRAVDEVEGEDERVSDDRKDD